VLDGPVVPLEEDLRDQIVRRGVAVIPYDSICGGDLIRSVDVEDPKRDPEPPSEALGLPDR
jgi:hypothetical protein